MARVDFNQSRPSEDEEGGKKMAIGMSILLGITGFLGGGIFVFAVLQKKPQLLLVGGMIVLMPYLIL